MWLRRTKPTTPFQKITSSPTFYCSSFKDIQSLFEEETQNKLNNNYKNTSAKYLIHNVFHRVLFAKSILDALSIHPKIKENVPESKQTLKSLPQHNKELDDSIVVVPIQLPGTETRVVIFFTSLRVVRSTFEDCKYVRTILHSFRVSIDERDLFMDVRFLEELQRIMVKDEKTKLTLPRVFIGGRYIGGAEEIRQLHEAGELKKYLKGMAPAPAGTCQVCEGHGFILCLECNGSHKCYADKGGFKTCNGCNENGLVRCSSCSSAPL